MERKIICLLLLLSFPLVCFAQDTTTKASPSYPLQLTIKSDKQVYGVGEFIYISYQLTNIGKEDIAIVRPFSEGGTIDPATFAGSLIVKREGDEDSTEVVPLSDISWTGLGTILLKKGESYNMKVNIVKIEGRGLEDMPYSTQFYLQQDGKYTITGKYDTDKYRESTISKDWKGTLTSNTITIEVVEKKSVSEGDRCKSNEDCVNIDCSKYDMPGLVEGFKPYCLNYKCKCKCYGCE